MCLAIPIGAAPAGAQADVAAPAGFRLGAALSARKPYLATGSERVYRGVGAIGAGVGLDVVVGYDGQRLGASLATELAQGTVGGRDAPSLAVAALLHWRVARPVAGWRAALATGFVRHGLASVEAAPREVPPEVGGMSHPGAYAPERLALLGNAVRFGVDAERSVSRRAALTVSVAADVAHFGSALYAGSQSSLREPGWSVIPRVALGARWRPFSR